MRKSQVRFSVPPVEDNKKESTTAKRRAFLSNQIKPMTLRLCSSANASTVGSKQWCWINLTSSRINKQNSKRNRDKTDKSFCNSPKNRRWNLQKDSTSDWLTFFLEFEPLLSRDFDFFLFSRRRGKKTESCLVSLFDCQVECSRLKERKSLTNFRNLVIERICPKEW